MSDLIRTLASVERRSFFKALFSLLVPGFSEGVSAQSREAGRARDRAAAGLEDVFAPVFIGRPPMDAHNGLVRLDSGEIRHYNMGGYGDQGGEIDESDPHYIFSLDNGFTWEKKPMPAGYVAAYTKSPISGEYVGLKPSSAGVLLIRSQGGIDGKWDARIVFPEQLSVPNPPLYIRRNTRLIAGCQGNGVAALYSDNDGGSWRKSNVIRVPSPGEDWIRNPNWNHPASEPAIVELSDGRLWMLIRTGRGVHWQSFSSDAGATWQEPGPTSFYSLKTMPVLKKLQDGRILFFWLNSSPLPPLPRSEVTRILMGNTRHFGIATDMFTNRDVHHAAISEDDGKTWIGFRELFLDPRRNAGDYAKTGGVDRGMHQSQCVELGNGKILVAFGQHPLHRSMAIFDLGWLYEKSRSDDFSRGSGGWSLQTYLVGVMGHRALNRRQGAQLIEHPAQAGKRVLHVCRTADPELISENQGAVWNFPAGRTGTFTTRIMLREGGQGARISLLDHWINPTDATVLDHAMYSLLVPGDGTAAGLAPFTPGVWHELRFEWADSRGSCKVAVDGRLQGAGLPLIRPAPNGICYVHFYSAATRQDGNGFLIESVAAAELHVCERG